LYLEPRVIPLNTVEDNMELGLAGKVAIVTGGSKGIGRATALKLLAEGGSVTVCARGKEALAETVAAAGDNRGRIEPVAADLTRLEDVKRVVARCVERFGRIDILVNNAGSARAGNFLELPDDLWIEDFTLKMFGYVRMTREVLLRMRDQKSGGVIVNIIGGAALTPSGGYTVGGAINAGVNHFTKSVAQEAAKYGVRVVGINPGPILTERLLKLRGAMEPGSASESQDEAFRKMTPLGRVGKPEEVADLVLFLASDRGSFIHATNVTIDGGSHKGLMG
jgi:NAD(P)-dependent dehydrogenase (short-subunit alcohol dehydrogenase family)